MNAPKLANQSTAPLRPVINITQRLPGQAPQKVARVVFPDTFTIDRIRHVLDCYPEAKGYRCDVRQVGPLGFSLPLDLAGVTL